LVRSSGRHLPYRADNAESIAQIARLQWGLGLHGLIVACPIPEQYAMDAAPLEAATDEALKLARAQGIRGAATTPFVLSHVARITAGESVEANKALLVNNAQWAATFARAYYHYRAI
jgi:pseudouridine-5'-phosphate glycosidase